MSAKATGGTFTIYGPYGDETLPYDATAKQINDAVDRVWRGVK